MGVIGRQFGRPTGVLGRLAGRFMARGNAELNQWITEQLATVLDGNASRIVEVGAGPGVGARALLAAFPKADLLAIDQSPALQRQLLSRNRAAVWDGRLQTLTGQLTDITNAANVDAVVAVHVLYFWTDPVEQLQHARNLLQPGGVLGLGYQLRAHMPAVVQRGFPASGHRVIDTDDQVQHLLRAAGLEPLPVRVLGDEATPTGRLMLARYP